MLGDGVAVEPEEGKVYAPADGTVLSVFDTKHAVCFASRYGTELLIHIGIDTVNLQGKYFTAHGESIDLENNSYAMIGVLDSFRAAREYYGTEKVIPIYIEVEDGERLQRALDRERAQETPGYAELCRRFLTDSEDFSEENIEKSGIEKRFQNTNLQECIQEITAYILEVKER